MVLFLFRYARPPLSKHLWRSPPAALDFTTADGEITSVWAAGSEEAPLPGQVKQGRVHRVDVRRKRVALEDGSEIEYGALLLATGARAVQLKHVDPAVASRVLTLRSLDDYRRLRELTAEPGVHVTVVGGGYLGTEVASSLARHTQCAVSQVLSEEAPMHRVFPAFLAREIGARLERDGVQLVRSTRALGVSQSRSGRPAVVLADGSTRETDVVLLALGVESDYNLLARSGLEIDDRLGGVVANAELQVASGVWACGDVVSYYDGSVGLRRRMQHADHATMSGIHAAQNMAGAGRAYDYLPVEFGSVAGLDWEGCGLLDARFDTVSLWDEDAGPAERGVVYYVEDGSVVGVLTVGLPERMDYAKKLVKFAFPVEDMKETMQLIYLGEK